MATNTKKSLLTYPLLTLFLGALLIGSCKQPGPGPDQVCIYNRKDTSTLGRQDHFISVKDIDRYKKDFDVERDSLGMKCPGIFIPNSETFNRAAIVQFLEDSTVAGLKFYYGIKPGKSRRRALRLMIVGVDSAGNNVYIKKKGSPLAAQANNDTEDGGAEYGQCTPPCTLDEEP
jgi:hypothetical protein